MKVRTNLILAITFFTVAIIVGSFIYTAIEGWRFLDSLYFVVMTITTIGFGDFVPLTDAGKIFTIFFSFFGIAAAFYFLGLIGREVFKKHISEKVTEMKRVVREDVEVKKGIEEAAQVVDTKLRKKKK